MNRIEQLQQFLKDNPNDSFVQHALALEYIKLGNDETAKQLFESILTREETYVGSYYHLAKLYERNGDTEAAINWYQKGIAIARKLGDNHARNELQMACDELVDD